MTAALVIGVAACAKRTSIPAAQRSGFLRDYSLLRPGGEGQPTWGYRDPNARLDQYTKVLFEPVTILRSGRQSLADVPQADLKNIAFELQQAVMEELEHGFTLVDQPGPGVLRIRLAITDARKDDPVVDSFTYQVIPMAVPSSATPLAPATLQFVDDAALEGELSDGQSSVLLAAGVDRRRPEAIQTWGDLREAVDRWAKWFESRLESGRGAR